MVVGFEECYICSRGKDVCFLDGIPGGYEEFGITGMKGRSRAVHR